MIANSRAAARAASLSEVLGIDAQATEWMRDALCAQTDPDAFHPDKSGSVEPAKAVCAGCPVLAECRAYALETDQRFGVWGGLSANERRVLRRQHRRETCWAMCPDNPTNQNEVTGQQAA